MLVFKGTVSWDFLLKIFPWIIFLQVPENYIRVISNFFGMPLRDTLKLGGNWIMKKTMNSEISWHCLFKFRAIKRVFLQVYCIMSLYLIFYMNIVITEEQTVLYGFVTGHAGGCCSATGELSDWEREPAETPAPSLRYHPPPPHHTSDTHILLGPYTERFDLWFEAFFVKEIRRVIARD
jgi:hypothetical protein